MAFSKPGSKRGAPRKPFVKTAEGKRILCLADMNGSLRQINRLVSISHADFVVHVGNFGFFDGDSADGMSAQMLADAALASSVVGKTRNVEGESEVLDFHGMDEAHLREVVGSQLSELPLYLAGTQKFSVPVYTIWGEHEDVHVLEKFFAGSYLVPNLHIVDTSTKIPGTPIRLCGVPGLFDPASLFNIGEGQTVAGTHGSTWASSWQIGELVQSVLKSANGDETRWLLTCSPTDRLLLDGLAMHLKCAAHIFSVAGYTSSSGFTNVYLSSLLMSAKSFKYVLSSLQSQYKRKWTSLLQSVDANAEFVDLLRTTASLLTTMPATVDMAIDNMWLCSLANNHRSSVLFKFDNRGNLSMDVKNLSMAAAQQQGKKKKNVSPEPNGGDLKQKSETEAAEKPQAEPTDPLPQGPASELNLPTEPSGKNKAKAKKPEQVQQPGLWFKNGDRSPEEILGFLSEEDRNLNPSVKIIKGKRKIDGNLANHALVLFDSQEQVSAAYERVDKDEAGTVSIYQPDLTTEKKSFKPRSYKPRSYKPKPKKTVQ